MTRQRIDWSQLWYPGRKHPFTPEEMALAGSDAPSPTLVAISAMNYATVAFVALLMSPATQTARLAAAFVALGVLSSCVLRWLWWRPWRKPLMRAQLGLALFMVLAALATRWRVPDPEDRAALMLLAAIGTSLMVVLTWFLVVWRAHAIEARLREQAEREKSIEMARRLAAAQIEPHFLFNTLASLQHWVQTKDDRAAPLLAALTGYLRATLPLFNHALLPAGQELVAVQRYLEVMQARMGARLRFTLDIEAGLERALLPPGLLLTLVENAIAHGLEPQLAGGQIRLRAHRQGADAVFEVLDDGIGPAPGMQDGVGLSNARQRLALNFGPAARLQIGPAPGGGCRAEISLPWREATN
jgi:hypothetical protein